MKVPTTEGWALMSDEDFVSEAALLRKLRSKFVVNIIGWVPGDRQVTLVTTFQMYIYSHLCTKGMNLLF